jgi:hypothetical protein
MEGVLLFTLQWENVALILLFHPIPETDRVPHVTRSSLLQGNQANSKQKELKNA